MNLSFLTFERNFQYVRYLNESERNKKGKLLTYQKSSFRNKLFFFQKNRKNIYTSKII